MYPNVVHNLGRQLKAHVVLLRVLGIAEGGVLHGVEPRIGDLRLGFVPEVFLAGAEGTRSVVQPSGERAW